MEAPNQNMINFRLAKGKFNYRISGILFRNGKVLFHKVEDGKRWLLPGGRADMLEDSKTSLAREFQEELDCEIEVQQLKYVVENFFNYRDTDYHELEFIYWVKIKNGKIPDEQFVITEFGVNYTFLWIPIEELGNHAMKPEFLQNGISIDSEFQHVIDI